MKNLFERGYTTRRELRGHTQDTLYESRSRDHVVVSCVPPYSAVFRAEQYLACDYEKHITFLARDTTRSNIAYIHARGLYCSPHHIRERIRGKSIFLGIHARGRATRPTPILSSESASFRARGRRELH